MCVDLSRLLQMQQLLKAPCGCQDWKPTVKPCVTFSPPHLQDEAMVDAKGSVLADADAAESEDDDVSSPRATAEVRNCCADAVLVQCLKPAACKQVRSHDLSVRAVFRRVCVADRLCMCLGIDRPTALCAGPDANGEADPVAGQRRHGAARRQRFLPRSQPPRCRQGRRVRQAAAPRAAALRRRRQRQRPLPRGSRAESV